MRVQEKASTNVPKKFNLYWQITLREKHSYLHEEVFFINTFFFQGNFIFAGNPFFIFFLSLFDFYTYNIYDIFYNSFWKFGN